MEEVLMYKGLAVVQAVRYRTWFDTTNSYINAIYSQTEIK